MKTIVAGPHRWRERAQLSIDSEGEISFSQQIPSVYDLAVLRPFTEETDRRIRITPASLRLGAKRNLTADDIIDRLAGLQAEPLSPELAAYVRRWAKDWGSGALLFRECAPFQSRYSRVLTSISMLR